MSRSKRTTNVHHLWWPSGRYKTPLERMFRELPCHKVELAIEAHNLIHRHSPPPDKPPPHEMVEIIQNHEAGRCTCNVIGPEAVRKKRRG